MTGTNRNDNDRESSARRGWLSIFVGSDDRDYRRRLVVAFALAIAIHEVLAGLIPGHWQPAIAVPAERISHVQIIALLHRPKPTPRPTPKPVVRTHVIAPTHVRARVIDPAKMSQNQHVRRHAQKRAIAHTVHHLAPVAIHVPAGGQGASTSTGKAATGGVGTGGTGTGTGGNANGLGGAPAANEPCGYVEFVNADGVSKYDPQTGGFFVDIKMIVHFPDHSEQSVLLDYPWYYPSQAANPWSDQNLANANFPVRFQAPPPDKTASEPPLVQYVIQHSTASGLTLLKDCPGDATPRP